MKNERKIDDFALVVTLHNNLSGTVSNGFISFSEEEFNRAAKEIAEGLDFATDYTFSVIGHINTRTGSFRHYKIEEITHSSAFEYTDAYKVERQLWDEATAALVLCSVARHKLHAAQWEANEFYPGAFPELEQKLADAEALFEEKKKAHLTFFERSHDT